MYVYCIDCDSPVETERLPAWLARATSSPLLVTCPKCGARLAASPIVGEGGREYI